MEVQIASVVDPDVRISLVSDSVYQTVAIVQIEPSTTIGAAMVKIPRAVLGLALILRSAVDLSVGGS